MPAPVEKTIGGLKVQSTPLLFDYAQPMLPTMMEIVALATQDLAGAVASKALDPKGDLADPAIIASMLPVLKNLGAYLQGRLESLAPKILATTRVAAPIASGDLEWHDLSKPKDRSYIFDEYPQLYLPVLVHAGVTTFGRFFPAIDRRGKSDRESSSKGSNPNT